MLQRNTGREEMKIAVVYYSAHHKNTFKVLSAMKEVADMDLFTVEQAKEVDLNGYDIIGFASGIYMNKFNSGIINFVKHADLNTGKATFIVYTCGVPYRDYAFGLKRMLKKKNCEVVGCFKCRGFDTAGIFAKIGGIAKGRPDEYDFDNARAFAAHLVGESL